MKIYVTVGTTSFDKLIIKFTEHQTLNVLKSLGYTGLQLQVGRSSYKSDLLRSFSTHCISIDSYDFKDSISGDIQAADLVVSHAGAGTCLEVLEAGKPLVVVINEDLMNNHQTELAEKLADEGYLVPCTCSSLLDTLQSLSVEKLKPWPQPKTHKFAEFLNRVMEIN